MDKIKFSTELTFNGNAEELGKLVEALDRLPIRPTIPRFPGPIAGGWPIPTQDLAQKFAAGGVTLKMPRDIAGGIRGFHVHTADGIHMIDEVKFKQFAQEVAGEVLAKAINAEGYMGAVNSMNNMVR